MRDSGLLDQLITPQFERRYPQVNLKFVAVGTGQAITNARAGQGDVLIGHSPPQEAQFLADGFSYESIGRTVMWNDYVLVGPAADPAGVLRAARNDAVGAFQAIAAAGAAGRAHFVSRGDNSGTNAKERDIWALTNVARNARNEPAAGTGNPGLVPQGRAGHGRHAAADPAVPVRRWAAATRSPIGARCSSSSTNGAITSLSVVMDDQADSARGGGALMLNVYNVYAISPSKYPATKLQAALAFLDFLTSDSFQTALAASRRARGPASSRPPSRRSRSPGGCRAASRPPAALTRPRHGRLGRSRAGAAQRAGAAPGPLPDAGHAGRHRPRRRERERRVPAACAA